MNSDRVLTPHSTSLPGTIDVLGLGAVAVDDFLFVDSFPPPDAKTYVRRRARQCGGLAATALVAAARLGAQCAYAGSLGSDDLSRFAVHAMEAEGIRVQPSPHQPRAKPVSSLIVVADDTASRNIFADLDGVVGADDQWPPEELIGNSKVLLVDHIGVDGMRRATEIARHAGIPVVGDLERESGPGFNQLLERVDHLIVSHEFALGWTQTKSPGDAVQRLWHSDRQVVVVTGGADGCWFRAQETGAEVIHAPTFPVKAVDSTGCGDAFHGAYAFGISKGLPIHERIRLASAVAALKATRPGGQAGLPHWDEVKSFLESRGS